jgi:hypothetical protein
MASRSILQRFDIASEVETKAFLTRGTVTDDALMRELWNTTGLPGLLDARKPGSAGSRLQKGEKEFIYDPLTGKYRRVLTGKSVSEREIRNAVFKASNEAKNRMRQETKQMMTGTILFVVWYYRIRSILKALLRAVWTVNLGGILFEDEATRNAFYLWSLLLFDRVDELKGAIDEGRIPFDGRILTSVGNIARSANIAFQNSKVEKGKKLGHDEAMRVLGENENHCHDSTDRPGCVELADLGWVRIDKLVPLGMATCWDNCMCQVKTRKRPND